MSTIDSETAKLDSALDETLQGILEDFSLPKETRTIAHDILNQRLTDDLRAAVVEYEKGTARLVGLTDQLTAAIAALGNKIPKVGAAAGLEKLLDRANEVHRLVHVQEGMRPTFANKQEAEEIHSDEVMLPPLVSPHAPLVTTLNATGEVLRAPVPVNSTKYETLADEYMRFFAGADYRNDNAKSIATRQAELCLKFKSRYDSVGQPLGIPWWFIACVHMMESDFNFGTHLHNGDPLRARTVNFPPGRPSTGSPPFVWEDSAKDALSGRKLNGQKDWSLPRALYRWEAYNGFGYRPVSVASPYLWSMSTIYRSGKYVRDGEFDRNAISQQCGVATVLKVLREKGAVELTLDRMSEAEPVAPPAVVAAVQAATAGGRQTIDDELPLNADFSAFLKEKAGELRHFSANEFLMLGGGGDNSLPPKELWPNVVSLAKVLDAFREKLGVSVVLTSIYRNEAHNQAVGGVQGSQHSRFCAADFQAKSGKPTEWAAMLRDMRGKGLFQGGIGLYSNFVHVDTRGWNADWTG
jgi:lysozyme family protein